METPESAAETGRQRPSSTGDTARRLGQSLAQTAQGLRTFYHSLQRAGMKEALNGYRQLQTVLIQQRLWARSQNRFELDSQFQEIGKICGDIHGMLGSYAEIMGRLEAIGNLHEAPTDPPYTALAAAPTDEEELETLTVLIALGPVSLVRLARETGRSAESLDGALHRLRAKDLIVTRGRGAGRSYRLAPAACAAALSAIVGGHAR